MYCVMMGCVPYFCWLVGWLQFPRKEDETRERNLRDDGVYDEVLCG